MSTLTDISLELFTRMLRIRRIEEALADRYTQQEMRCPMHLSIGQEAVAVGVMSCLDHNDAIFGSHRSHAQYLAAGGDVNALIAELYGKATGCSKGYGGSMHLIDLAKGFQGSTAIVGGTVPLALGAAWSFQYRQKPQVGVAFFGDGCFEEGVVHECLNYAALKKLPVIFICENNLYSVYTHLQDRQPDRPIHEVARAQGWTTYHGDGNQVTEVRQLAQTAVRAAKEGQGPQFIELKTYRWMEHCGPYCDDHLSYRPEGELDSWKKRCPIEITKSDLLAKGLLSPEQLNTLENTIAGEIEEAFNFALNSPNPQPHDMSQNLYAR